MPKDLLRGIVDRKTCDLLDRKGKDTMYGCRFSASRGIG
jgi:hypothetical protein